MGFCMTYLYTTPVFGVSSWIFFTCQERGNKPKYWFRYWLILIIQLTWVRVQVLIHVKKLDTYLVVCSDTEANMQFAELSSICWAVESCRFLTLFHPKAKLQPKWTFGKKDWLEMTYYVFIIFKPFLKSPWMPLFFYTPAVLHRQKWQK